MASNPASLLCWMLCLRLKTQKCFVYSLFSIGFLLCTLSYFLLLAKCFHFSSEDTCSVLLLTACPSSIPIAFCSIICLKRKAYPHGGVYGYSRRLVSFYRFFESLLLTFTLTVYTGLLRLAWVQRND